MNEITLIGIDLGKHVFHLHAQDVKGHEVFRKKLTRSQLLPFFGNLKTVTVVMEACAGSHWLARQLIAMGHAAKLISPQYVRPFVKSNKNDYIDAEAICEAAARPSMRFVEPRSEAQQTLAALHRVREGLVVERTATINRIHGILLEFGISLPSSKAVLHRLSDALAVNELPRRLAELLHRLHEHYRYLDQQVHDIDKDLTLQLREDENAARLLSIPGIGVVTASLLASEIGNVSQYEGGRNFAASIGLVPKQHSTGGRNVLYGISKRGDKHLRHLLVQCARAVIQRVALRTDRLGEWIRSMLTRRHSNVVACAVANKLARIAWAVLTKHAAYDPSLGCRA
ncbi:IS110 family transposase [Burkholderia ubonensis]|uniref:Transposase n=2 Tax=Burkholderia ubonensis TaxID=101571 RepID=A0A119MFA0_9BURK|nr:IS110 family transposase [Burkholderia ubonensis]AOK59167.1 transposase [Burkholderia ubonensis]AOK62070.1 transposase [Burkholderia ubonensis]KVS47112.1 transposase [Burkholderia ubonensis]KVS48514.1 transposase [Burkholderia ubonensis]KVS68489.1 transposase [Burkholderia ubonensis]